MCVQSRFAEIRKNLSFQSSHLQALGSVFTWMMYAYDKYAKVWWFCILFLKEGTQHFIRFSLPGAGGAGQWCVRKALGSRVERPTQVSSSSETWTVRGYVGGPETGASLSLSGTDVGSSASPMALLPAFCGLLFLSLSLPFWPLTALHILFFSLILFL